MLKDDKNLTKSLTETTYLDLPLETFKILDQPEETAEVIDLMSPGPLRDELRGTYDPSQESYEDYLRRQSIPQEERPLTGQTPTQQLFGINRQEVNSGGLIARQAYNMGTVPLLTAGRKAIENFLKASNFSITSRKVFDGILFVGPEPPTPNKTLSSPLFILKFIAALLRIYLSL